MSRVHYNVIGLQNATTKTQIKNVLNDLDGIKNVNVDVGRSTVDVDYNKNINETEIRRGIEQVGCRIE